MALTPFDMEGVNRDLLAAGNPAKPDMQSILRRNARDLVLGNAILVSSADAKELEFGVHMAYSDADGGFDTDPSEDVWFEASSLPIPNERPDLPPDNALRIRVTDVLTEYGFTDIDVKAPDRTPEGIWIGFEAMQPVRLDVTSAQEGRSVSFTLTAAEANDWRSGRLDAHGLSRMAVERVLARPGGTSITFDAFADESRQTDYRMETGALRDFFNGSQSALSSYRNPMGGNPLIAFGSIGRWDGERTGISSFETFDDLMNGDDSPFKDCEIDHIWDENGILKMRGHHHDGSVEVEIRQLTDQGCEALESYEQAWAGEPFDAAGRHYDGGKESVDRFWNDLKTDRGLSVEPRYVELAFGCPPIEWDIDARVRDFAERMGDEYTSLYEQDTTSIKGGDFERFGAFADNHLDFIRALTKARGMDPISSDREIGAFLNTFDKLAAMPEPTPAKQEKDELSAGACDPADPLNLEQSSSYGMTR